VADAAQTVLRRTLPKLIAGNAPARPLDLKQGSYFGRRRPEDGRIDWRAGARAIHDLVRAVAPPFPGAFTDLKGRRLEVWETRIDPQPARHFASAPCLYAEEGRWYVDCTDGKRLEITRLAVSGEIVNPASPPQGLQQPVRLER
jgi:methionyl-tRNA formyltransferase